MKALLFERTRNTWIQLFRYLWVGGLAAAVDTGTLYLLHYRLALNYLLSAAAGFVLGLLTNYMISIAWVFESTGRIRSELALFTMIGLGGLGLTELILWIGTELLRMPVMTAKIVALTVVLSWNFGMRRKFVFNAEPVA